MRCLLSVLFLVAALPGVSQTTSWQSKPAPDLSGRFYAGLEGVIFANKETQFTTISPLLTSETADLAPYPALLLGYQFSSRFALEGRMQELGILNGFNYTYKKDALYIGFGESFSHSYLYLPVHAVWCAVGANSKLRLSVLAGVGPAFTSTKPSWITPNGTEYYSRSPDGRTISVGDAPVPGFINTASTQLITREQAFMMCFEAGLRGTWQVRPRWALDLSVRQLWGSSSSVRDIKLDIVREDVNYTTSRISTTMRTPVRGICTGLSLRYYL